MENFNDRLAAAIALRNEKLAAKKAKEQKAKKPLSAAEQLRFEEAKQRLLARIPLSHCGDLLFVLPMQLHDLRGCPQYINYDMEINAGPHTVANLVKGTAPYAMAELMLDLGHWWGLTLIIRPENEEDSVRLGIKPSVKYLDTANKDKDNAKFVLMLSIFIRQ